MPTKRLYQQQTETDATINLWTEVGDLHGRVRERIEESDGDCNPTERPRVSTDLAPGSFKTNPLTKRTYMGWSESSGTYVGEDFLVWPQ